jgi:hypothetical protein
MNKPKLDDQRECWYDPLFDPLADWKERDVPIPVVDEKKSSWVFTLPETIDLEALRQELGSNTVPVTTKILNIFILLIIFPYELYEVFWKDPDGRDFLCASLFFGSIIGGFIWLMHFGYNNPHWPN